MLVKLLTKLTVAATILSFCGIAALAQQGQQKKSPWKDRAEYDMYNAMAKEPAAAKKVQLLDSYLKKYPESKFKLQVYLMYAQAYQKLAQPDKMYEAAQKVLALDPKNVQGLYFVTSLTISMAKTDPTHLSNGDKAAKALLAEVAAMKKPAQMSDANWKKQKDSLIELAQKTIGWVAMTRKNNAAAERAFRAVLKINPNNGQVSYWLGTVILAQRDASKQAQAMYHFARAASYTGPGAMTPQGRQKVDAYVRKIYSTYHGSEEGLDAIYARAKSNPFPPAGFKIKSKEQLAAEADEKMRQEHPMLYMWLNVRKQLEAPNGKEYFNSSVKNTAMPQLRGYIISQSPARRPDTLVLGIQDRNTREVTLKLDEAFRYPARRGTVLRFTCVPQRFTQSPFNLGFDCEQSKVKGWPPPPSRKKTR